MKRAKKKITSLEREVSDLQSEFEQDRTDYLETIRRQEQQVKLFSQILEKTQPCIRRDCNYSNLDRIKNESIWDEDLQKWRLPELIVTRTKLPPAMDANGHGGIHSAVNGQRTGLTDYEPLIAPVEEELLVVGDQNGDDKLFERLEKGAQENLAANYFKPKRRDMLLNHVQKVTNGELIADDQNGPNCHS